MQFVKNHSIWVFGVIILILLFWLLVKQANTDLSPTAVTDVGTVSSFVSVSGTTKVADIIPLSFSRAGTVSGVFVSPGDEVATGTILAIIGDSLIKHEYDAAFSEVIRTRAVRDELLAGQTEEEARVTATIVKNAEDALTNTILTEAAKVESARTLLYNTGLTAIAINPNTEASPPLISGSYTCTAEGDYIIEPYRSGTLSGYSYRYTGIETGTTNANINQPGDLGVCGLRIQFNSNVNYNNTRFIITIPNTKSATYANNYALYEQALAQEKANIDAARRTLDLALDQATVTISGTRVERLIAANAVVAGAEARLSQIVTTLGDSTIHAPRSGIITDSNIVVGQVVNTTPILTLFAPTKTTVTARIPEKDVTKVSPGQNTQLTFDAKPNEHLTGVIVFISPLQTIVNGIPYYEAIIELEKTPTWIRSGMQTDIRIITHELINVVRIPRPFLIEGNIFIRRGKNTTTISPDILLLGTDGFVAVSNINPGEELVIPQ